MKLFRILLVILLIGVYLKSCSPPPDLPEKEEVVSNVKFKGDYTKDDVQHFLKFLKAMQKAVNEKNADASFSFYSEDFMSDSGVKLEDLKKNTELLYEVYSQVKYIVKDVKIYVKDDKAVSSDNFTYSAVPIAKGYKKLSYKGQERIYWQKEGDEWKIINWVYE